MIRHIITAVSLTTLIVWLILIIINCLAKNRSDRISFIRGFKKGKCVVVYLAAIPLYCMGYIYSGKFFLEAFFESVSEALSLVALKYDTGGLEALMAADSLYRFTIYFTYTLVALNAILLTLSLTNQYIWRWIQELKMNVTPKNRLFLIGNNSSNVSIYLSDSRYSKMVVDFMSGKDREALYLKKIAFVSTHSKEEYIEKIFNRSKKSKKEYVLIVNTGDDVQNLTLCRAIIAHIDVAENKDALFSSLRVYVFGDPKYEAVYNDIVTSASGCIHYINKYKKIANDFVDSYPLSKFMDEDHIDYSTALVRDGVDINVLMIGFGKTNQQIFLTSVANNQFLTAGESGPVLKPVNYYMFDKEKAENNKNLNHSYYRYKHERVNFNAEDYLPLPAIPAEETYYHINVNDMEFYNRIQNIVSADSRDVNFVIIAFGSDLENIDMAQKLIEKRAEWGLDNLIIFVKVRAYHMNQTLLEEQNCYFMANENDVVYNLDKLLDDKIFRMAKMRNEVYDLENAITHNPDIVINEEYLKSHHETSKRNWYISKTQMERESSVYCCLSLRSKLNLMGLDYCEADSPFSRLSEQEYLNIYARGDMPTVGAYDTVAHGKPIIDYSLDFKHSLRETMAIHEHHRWNSFMISKGMIPASIDQIIYEKDKNGRATNGRNYAVRRHGNLTTFEGLTKFRKLLTERENKDEIEFDVIKYDYQLLDDAYWLLNECGYKIIKKTN